MQFHVENMTCGSCAKHVTQAITGLDANAKVEVSVAERRMTVDSSATRSQLSGRTRSSARSSGIYLPLPHWRCRYFCWRWALMSFPALMR